MDMEAMLSCSQPCQFPSHSHHVTGLKQETATNYEDIIMEHIHKLLETPIYM